MIQIQYEKEQYKQVLIEMWKLCFPDDTSDFRNFYFDNVYKNEETLILLEDNHLIASLQMIPYQIKIEDKIYPASYISGAMTHPDFQGKGFMGKLLNHAFDEMKRNAIPITFLIPQKEWLFDFYAKYGYQKAFPYNSNATHTIKDEKNENSYFSEYKTLDEINLKELYLIYSTFLNKKKNVVLKTIQQFSTILEDIFLDNGTVFVGKNEIALTIPEKSESSIKLKECFCDEAIKESFLSAISKFSGKKEIIEINSPNNPFSHYCGMMRVLDESLNISNDIYMNTMLN